MNKERVDIARGLLLQWMSCGESKRSFDSIKKNCDYLDQAYGLGLEGYAVWTIFQPLFRTGVVEFVGKDCYAVAPSIAVERDGHYVYNSNNTQKEENRTRFTGIFRTSSLEVIEGIKTMRFYAATVLKNIPSVKEVVDSFDVSIEDLSHADYYHYRGRKGLTKRLADGAVRYFCIPEILYQREVPDRAINPDAFGIAYNYSRSLNNESAGLYNRNRQTLKMNSFGLPSSIERILFLESMLQGYSPGYTTGAIIFPAISPDVVKQLDRILCNTIEHE